MTDADADIFDQLVEWETAQENRNGQPRVEVTDNIIVQFDAKDEEIVFTLAVTNRSKHILTIERVDITSKFIKLQNDLAAGERIVQDGSLNLIFSVKRDDTKQTEKSALHIVFPHTIIIRTIQVYFESIAFTRNNSRWIQQKQYDCPHELVTIFGSNSSQELIKRNLDELIPTAEHLNWDNYAMFWHNLLWIEELGLIKSFRIYTKPRAYFRKKNGKFEMEMDNLFETRPSLKIGERILNALTISLFFHGEFVCVTY